MPRMLQRLRDERSERLQALMVDSLAKAPADATPIEAVAAALAAPTGFFNDELRLFSRLRNSVIAGSSSSTRA